MRLLIVVRSTPSRLAELLLCRAESRQVVLEPAGFLNRVKVGAVDILSEGGFQRLLVIEFDDVNWHFRQAKGLGSAEPAFAGHKLEVIAGRSDQQRL